MLVMCPRSVAIIGAGAAGLIFADSLLRRGIGVTVYEQQDEVGGVWRYRPGESAMYQSLRTNLPKEIMAIDPNYPILDTVHSFLTHEEVQRYLLGFCDQCQLRNRIRFNTKVNSVTAGSKDDATRIWLVQSTHQASGEVSTDCFDTVVVCNGHFSVPFIPPPPPGFQKYFAGQSVHSCHYDTLKPSLVGKRVLVVGSKSSGTDIARELLSVAKHVFVSDRNYASCQSSTHSHNLGDDSPADVPILLPAIAAVNEEGAVEFLDGTVVPDVDVVIWCTGYLYDYPFLSASPALAVPGVDNVDLELRPPSLTATSKMSTKESDGQTNAISAPLPVVVEDGKRVRPLFQQLFSIDEPSLIFAGLPFRVVPFPLFRFQAEYVAAVLTGKATLPSREQQESWLAQREAELRRRGQYAEKYHYLGDGSDQWDYCRWLAREAGLLSYDQQAVCTDETAAQDPSVGAKLESPIADARSTTTTTTTGTCYDVNRYISLMEGIYNDNVAHRPVYPGAPDTYRERRYHIDWKTYSWTVEEPALGTLVLL